MAVYTTIDDSSLFMNTVLYTGNSSTQAVTGVGFPPDLVWLKDRSRADNNALYDTVRGVTKAVYSDSEDAESTHAIGLTAFDSDGWTMGSDSQINYSPDTYVGWNWKAGTAVSGATTGTGTAKTYTGSKNTTAGFSIIKYVGNGTAGHTIPHELGAIPDMITVKNLTTGSTNWRSIFPNVNTANYNLNFNAGNPWNDGTEFNDTMPTTSVFTVSTAGDTNTNDSSYIAYCWKNVSGYSKFGPYTGNADADGTFCYTGFKPSYVVCKRTDSTEDWGIWGYYPAYNVLDRFLYANGTNAEYSISPGDFVSNGFKIRTTDGKFNASGGTYIYMAFAEAPFVNSESVPCNAR